MISNKALKNLVNLFSFLLILTKFFSYLNQKIEILFFVFWSMPILFLIFFANKLTIKAFQSFSFIFLIYFLYASLRVFGISPYVFDLLEIVLIVILFFICVFAPKIIMRNM